MGHPIDLIDVERFWSHVDRSDRTGCWPWTLKVDRYGYGVYVKCFGSGRSTVRYRWSAHRAAYELLVGPIPDGLVIDHLCRVRNCVNPAHLEPVTNAENIRRGDTGKHFLGSSDVCKNGHPRTAENTTYRDYGEYRPYPICGDCTAERRRRHRSRQGNR